MKNKIVRLKKYHQRLQHPWIFKREIAPNDSSAKPGDIVTVVDKDNSFVGRGYYNPNSLITVRILSFDNEEIDKSFFDKKIKAAHIKRQDLSGQTNAYRIVFSEADGLPGLIVDIYQDTVVFQVLTLGMEMQKNILVNSITDVIKPKYIYEKSDAFFRSQEKLPLIKKWQGNPGNNIIEIFEGQIKFYVDIENGHKTGFYLDQRKARLGLRDIVKGKRVLDLFCYSGGFALAAAVFGAESVHAIDIKQDWLDLAGKNAALNHVEKNIKFVKADAFPALEEMLQSGDKFDVIILDPPSFLRSKKAINQAVRGYEALNTFALKLLHNNGILCTFSCSHNMPNEMFSAMLKNAAKNAGKAFTILKRCHQAIDHPIIKEIPETEYLKGYFLKLT